MIDYDPLIGLAILYALSTYGAVRLLDRLIHWFGER